MFSTSERSRVKAYYVLGYAIHKNLPFFKKFIPEENLYKKVALILNKSYSTIYRCRQFYEKYPDPNQHKEIFNYTWREIVKNLPKVPVEDITADILIIRDIPLINLQKAFNYLRNHKYFLMGFYTIKTTPVTHGIVASKDMTIYDNLDKVVTYDEFNAEMKLLQQSLKDKSIKIIDEGE
jgi:hypothetical protein